MKLSKIPNLPNVLGALFVFYIFFAKFLVVISPLAKKNVRNLTFSLTSDTSGKIQNSHIFYFLGALTVCFFFWNLPLCGHFTPGQNLNCKMKFDNFPLFVYQR